MRGLFLLILVSLCVSGVSLNAQNQQLFEIGEYVRITAPDCGVEEQVARYLRLFRDTLSVQAETQLDFPVDCVTALEVSRGISNRPTYIGIAAGAFVGIVFGIAVATDGDSEFTGGTPTDLSRPQIVSSNGKSGSSTMSGPVVGPVAGALIGSFLGGLVGKGFRRHMWEEIPLDRMRVDIVPRREGFAVGMKLAF